MRVYRRRLRFQRRHRIRHKGQWTILHPHQLRRRAGRVQVVRGHRRHFVAHKPDARVQQGQIRGQARRRRIGRRNCGAHAGQRQRRPGVHAQNVGVRMRAAHNNAMQHPRQRNVRRIQGSPSQLVRQLPAGDAAPNDSRGWQRRGSNSGHNALVSKVSGSARALVLKTGLQFVLGQVL